MNYLFANLLDAWLQMDGSFVRNMMNTFSEARYYLNVKSMVIFDHHSNIIAATLGLKTLLPS